MSQRTEEQPEIKRPREGAPRIYVASLSDYNAGRLHGAWITAAQDVDGLHEQIGAMLAASPTMGAEEWAIHDYEGFGPVHLSEYEPLDRVSVLGQGIAEYGDAFGAFAALVDNDPERLPDFESAYRGQWESLTDYADELLDDLGAKEALAAIPDWLQPYVSLDVAGFARDMRLGGDIHAAPGEEGGVHVFDATV